MSQMTDAEANGSTASNAAVDGIDSNETNVSKVSNGSASNATPNGTDPKASQTSSKNASNGSNTCDNCNNSNDTTSDRNSCSSSPSPPLTSPNGTNNGTTGTNTSNTSNSCNKNLSNFSSFLRAGTMRHLEQTEFYVDEDDVERYCTPGTWSNCDSTTFDVRRGPDYKPNSNQKAPSGTALYSVFAMDAYKSPFKINKLSQFVDLRDHISSHCKNDNCGPWHPYSWEKWPLPPLVIVNFMIPNYAPSVFGTDKTDGEGLNLVVYAHMTQETRNELEKLHSGEITRNELSPSVRLFSRFIHAAETRDSLNNYANAGVALDDIDLHGLTREEVEETLERFKIIIRVMNYVHTQMPYALHPIIKNYNAKPFLCRTSSTFYHEPGRFFAVDIDAHVFGKLARKSLSYLKGCMETVIFDGAFVIEGRENDEMPERVLASGRISKTGMGVAEPLPQHVLQEYLRRKEANEHMDARCDVNARPMATDADNVDLEQNGVKMDDTVESVQNVQNVQDTGNVEDAEKKLDNVGNVENADNIANETIDKEDVRLEEAKKGMKELKLAEGSAEDKCDDGERNGMNGNEQDVVVCD